MFAQKAYWLETRTSRSYETMDEEEHAALVSIMRSLASFCGINILTYQIKSGNLSMLVSCPSREHHLAYFQDSSEEPAGSGTQRLFKHLRKLYTASHVEALATEYEALIRHNEDTLPFWERYTRRIGTPRKFAEGINEAFARWIKKNRPQLYESLEGRVCRKDINQTYLEQLQKQRDAAFNMDEAAIIEDDGSEPRKYWCGFADAMRGDENALDGLRELMRSKANNTQEIKDLGYGNQRTHYVAKGENPIPSVRRKHSKHIERSNTRNANHKVDQLAEHIAPVISAPPQPMDHTSKLKLMSAVLLLLVIICGVGAFVAIKEWRKYQENTQTFEAANSEPMTADLTENESPQTTTKGSSITRPTQINSDLKKEKQDQITARLYEAEARQLANDFGMSANPQVRISMCRHQDQIKNRLDRHQKQILNEVADKVTFIDVADLGGTMAARFIAKFSNNKSRLICVVSTEDGLRVDLDSYTRYNNFVIPSLLSGEVKSAELRVLIERSDYYNFTYKDEVNWSSFKIKSPDSEEVLYAYSKKQTTTGKLLDAALSRASGSTVQVTVQISSNNNSHQKKQFTIDRVYAFGWLRSAIDIEETYRAKLEALAR